MRVGASMINLLTREHAQYNLAMETTGLSAGLVQFGLTAPQFVNCNKLILLVEIDDVKEAQTIIHSRLLREMITGTMLGGEHFGGFLDVICNKARETFAFCQKLADEKNKDAVIASRPAERWHCLKVEQTFDLGSEHEERIDAFYNRQNFDLACQ